MDVLAEMLASLRLTGGVFLDGEFRAPWSVRSHIAPEDCAPFFDEPPHLIGYHYIRSGSLTCRVGSRAVLAHAGEIVIIPRNEPHVMEGRIPAKTVEARSLLGPAGADGLYHVRWGGGGELTSMYCGYLGTTTGDNALLQALPSIMTIDVGDALGDAWVRRSIDFAAQGLSATAPEMVGKVAEGLFAVAVRRYLEAMPEKERGWLGGLRDPLVGKALVLIHRRYAEDWTLDQLADEAGASRTVLGDRFRALIGDSPMQYLSEWRMRMAAEKLRLPGQNAASVAYAVGFGSEAAFSRAFKRTYGAPPAAWQRELTAA